MLSFFSSRWNPSLARECPPPPPHPLVPGGGAHSLAREGVWESPNSDEGTYTVVLFKCMYFVKYIYKVAKTTFITSVHLPFLRTAPVRGWGRWRPGGGRSGAPPPPCPPCPTPPRCQQWAPPPPRLLNKLHEISRIKLEF